MRLVSYRSSGSAKTTPWRAGVVRDGDVVDVGSACVELSADGELSTVKDFLALDDRLSEVADLTREAAPVGRIETLKIGPPVPDPEKILCIGLNYAEHAEETKIDSSEVPTVFCKFANSLVGDGDPVVVPVVAKEIDYEGELAVVIGRRCRRVSAGEALEYVAGVMPLNDVSARDLQMQTPQWTAGKAVDTFAPCGPHLVLMDEIDDIQDLRIQTRVNGETVQDASTALMLHDVARIISFLSSVMTLEVGDIIATGTPAGVGFTREPPLLLHAGDVVEVDISGVGLLRNVFEDETE